MRILKYRYHNGEWKRIRLDSYKDLCKTKLWNELEDYSGRMQVIYAGRRYTVKSQKGCARRLVEDAIAYEMDGKSFTGSVDYGSSGSVRWCFEPSLECSIYASIWLVAYIALALYGCWYLPVWLITVYFILKRKRALKEWK